LDLTQFGLTEISLMDGERVDTALDLAGSHDVLLLTPSRVMHVQGNGSKRKSEFALVENIDTVETGFEREGNGVYVWAATAFVVAALLFFVIENATGRIAAPVVVALLGLYLIADHVIAPGCPIITFKAGGSQFRCELSQRHDSIEVSGFVNRLFEIKTRGHGDSPSQPGRFAPR
jgi:hypothetical protein